MKKCWPIGWLICLSFSLHAEQNHALLDEYTYFEELPVVLSGSRLEQKMSDSPVAITIIDRQLIEASGARQIEELLRLAPGLIVGHQLAHQGVVTQGALLDEFARRMLIMVDGRAVYTPTLGGVPWNNLALPLEDIERIEVVRGPNAASYGANAFLGTINIITRNPFDSTKNRVTIQGGNDGIYQERIKFASKSDSTVYSATIGIQGDHGFDGLATNVTDDDDSDTRFMKGQAAHTTHSGQNWVFSFGAAKSTVEAGRPTGVYDPSREFDTAASFQHLEWTNSTGQAIKKSLQIYHNVDLSKEFFITPPVSDLGGIKLGLDSRVKGHRYGLEYQQSAAVSKNIRLLAGSHLRRDEVKSSGFLNKQGTVNNDYYNFFIHGEWQAQAVLLINAGMLVEHNDYSSTDISPRLAFNFSLPGDHTIRLSTSRAHRTPFPIEQQGNNIIQLVGLEPLFVQGMLSSNSLDSETIDAHEIGYLGFFPSLPLSLEIRIFKQNLGDIIRLFDRTLTESIPDIVPANAGEPVKDFANMDKIAIEGFDLSLNYQPLLRTRAVLNYAYTEINSNQTEYEISGPRHNLSAIVTSRLTGKLDGSIGFYYLSHVVPLTRSGVFGGDDQRFEATLTYNTNILGHPVRWQATAQAIGHDYVDFRNRNILRNRVYSTLTWEF